YLYKLGRPVSAFDIAELVRGPMQGRKRSDVGEGVSIIDKLIQETLFAFTSLQDKDAEPVPTSPRAAKKDEPFNLTSFEDFAGWSDTQNRDSQANLLVSNTLSVDLDEGNLAALEDDEPVS